MSARVRVAGSVRPADARGMDGAEFARVRLGFQADERQAEVLRSESKRGILNCSRQWGKSTVGAAMAVRRAMAKPRGVILVAAPSRRQSAELVEKAREMAERAGIRVRGDGKNRDSLVFPNRSRIIALPGRPSTIRGYAAALVLIDEAGYVDDRLYEALRPMLAATKGDLWMMSTPNGRQGFFYRTWAFGGDRWHRVRGPADCEEPGAGWQLHFGGGRDRCWNSGCGPDAAVGDGVRDFGDFDYGVREAGALGQCVECSEGGPMGSAGGGAGAG